MSAAFYRRKFLNSEAEGGIALVEAKVDEPDKPGASFDATLKVGDCNRIVELQFGVWTRDDAAEVRRKVATLRTTLAAFEAVLLQQISDFERNAAND